jgi:uncharacterized membrane protein
MVWGTFLKNFASPLTVFAGASSFIGSHYYLSQESVRDDLIKRYGKDKFLGIYSAVALATFAPTVYFYYRYGRGKGLLFFSGQGIFNKAMSISFKSLAAITFAQSVFQDNPIIQKQFSEMESNGAKSKKPAPEVQVQGIFRITRHAMFLSFGLLGVGQMFVRGALAGMHL